MKTILLTAAPLLCLSFAAPAQAAEVFGGVYVHDVDTPLNLSGIEDGADFQLGVRAERLPFLHASPYAFVSVNSAGDTNFAAAGLSWKIGGPIYVRPGIGLALHTGPSRVRPGRDRIDFGSRVLFEPELAVGAQIGGGASIEASWVHLSHATLFSGQNPGTDNFGVRLNYRF
jgi:hypothetical protein